MIQLLQIKTEIVVDLQGGYYENTYECIESRIKLPCKSAYGKGYDRKSECDRTADIDAEYAINTVTETKCSAMFCLGTEKCLPHIKIIKFCSCETNGFNFSSINDWFIEIDREA